MIVYSVHVLELSFIICFLGNPKDRPPMFFPAKHSIKAPRGSADFDLSVRQCGLDARPHPIGCCAL